MNSSFITSIDSRLKNTSKKTSKVDQDYSVKLVEQNRRSITFLSVTLYLAFSFMDLLFLGEYWLSLFAFRLSGACLILLVYTLSDRWALPKLALGYTIFLTIALSNAVIASLSSEAMAAYNINISTLYLAASFVTIWHWRNSLLLFVIHCLAVYIIALNTDLSFATYFEKGLVMPFTSGVMWVVINAIRYQAIREEFMEKFKLAKNNEALRNQRTEVISKVQNFEMERLQMLNQQHALEHKNRQMKIVNKDLELINKNLIDTLNTVTYQNEVIAKTNNNITASINYAKRIQEALLPMDRELKDNFKDIFVFFKPKDIVSGDFYLFIKKGRLKFISAIDCTGHGVPGGFMSMLSSELISEVIDRTNLEDPGEILKVLDGNVRRALNQEESGNRDGMDISLCVIDEENESLRFAGAKHPLTYIRHGYVERIKGSRFSIGGHQFSEPSSFATHEICTRNTTFYLYSDGYQDQTGGDEGRKILSKNFNHVLQATEKPDLAEQKKSLDKYLFSWRLRGHYKQVDDILVMGFRV